MCIIDISFLVYKAVLSIRTIDSSNEHMKTLADKGFNG